MARHYMEREIGGQRWLVNEFSASEGLKIFVGLAKLLGGPLGKAIGALQGGKALLDAKLDTSLLGSALGDLADRLDEDSIVQLVKRMLRSTTVVYDDGKKGNAADDFETLFMGRLGTLGLVLAFVAEVNFKVPLADLLATGVSAASNEGADG